MKNFLIIVLAITLCDQVFAEEKFDLTIGPVIEYIDLKQIDANDPFAPRDKGFLAGVKATAGWSSGANGLEVNSSLKYVKTLSGSVTYDGSGSDDGINFTEVRGLRSDYELLDFDATIGYRFNFNDLSVAPFVGYKYFKWDNVLDPGAADINEISKTKGLLYGLDLKSGKLYARLGIVSPSSIDIEFNIPGENFPDAPLGKKTSTNLTLGYDFNDHWSVSTYYNRYKSGTGFTNGEAIKTPVDIATYGVTALYRW